MEKHFDSKFYSFIASIVEISDYLYIQLYLQNFVKKLEIDSMGIQGYGGN
jgi:hypothetical protein